MVNMRKICILCIFSLLLCNQIFAEEDGGTFSDVSGFDADWDAQKVIPTGQFEETLKKMKNPKNKKKRNEHSELMPSSILSEEDLPNTLKDEKTTNTILIPTLLGYENGVIPVGFYKIAASQQEDGNFYLDFYQGLEKIASCPAYPSRVNYDKEDINYAEFVEQNINTAKIIYGSLDYNLETIVRIYKN